MGNWRDGKGNLGGFGGWEGEFGGIWGMGRGIWGGFGGWEGEFGGIWGMGRGIWGDLGDRKGIWGDLGDRKGNLGGFGGWEGEFGGWEGEFGGIMIRITWKFWDNTEILGLNMRNGLDSRNYILLYWLKELQESMDRCTGRRDITE